METKYPIDNIELSLVIPAYNEESRLASMIESTIKFLRQGKFKYEIIIVNDGSKDKTWAVIEELMNKSYLDVEISGVTYNKNGGKGWAVATGMKFARGKYILMLDADGATNIENYDKLKQEMDKFEENQHEEGVLVVGSRQIKQQEAKVSILFLNLIERVV